MKVESRAKVVFKLRKLLYAYHSSTSNLRAHLEDMHPLQISTLPLIKSQAQAVRSCSSQTIESSEWRFGSLVLSVVAVCLVLRCVEGREFEESDGLNE